MWSRFSHISFARLVTLCLLLSISALTLTALTGCDPIEPTSPFGRFADASETIVLETDSTEWHVCVFATGKLYTEAAQIQLQYPWEIPTKEDAQILKTLTYPNSERFVTCDGYTFGMPSASVSKAGAKTKYSVLGLWKRKTTIEVTF